MKFGIPNMFQSSDIAQNKGISEFQIPGQSLINKNCQKPVMILT